MICRIFVLVQKDSNAKKESFCCTQPYRLVTKYTTHNRKSKKESQSFFISTIFWFPELTLLKSKKMRRFFFKTQLGEVFFFDSWICVFFFWRKNPSYLFVKKEYGEIPTIYCPCVPSCYTSWCHRKHLDRSFLHKHLSSLLLQELVDEREGKRMFDNRVRISSVQYRRPQR
jgi:hypothetical protein